MGQSTIAREQLRAFIERIERLEEEKKSISEDIRDVYAEAKGNGYDVKVMREVIKLRKQEAHERQEHEAVLDLYKHALGMIPSGDVVDGPHSSQQALPKPTNHDLLVKAHTAIVDANKASFSVLKNALGVSDAKAGSLFRQLEKLQVISPAGDQMKRDILITDLDFCKEKQLLDA